MHVRETGGGVTRAQGVTQQSRAKLYTPAMRQRVQGTEQRERITAVLGFLQFSSGHIDRLTEMAAPLYEVLVGTAWNKPKEKKE
jgi:hypothetical protein